MSSNFKSFKEVDLSEFSKLLKNVSQLSREVQQQSDERQDIDTTVIQDSGKRNKAVLDAIEKLKDEKTGIIAAADKKNDLKALKGPISGIIDYFNTVRKEMLPTQPAIELNTSKTPFKLLDAAVAFQYGPNPKVILTVKGTPRDWPLTYGLMYLMLLPIDTIRAYDLMREITAPDYQTYIDMIKYAGEGKHDSNPKMIKIKDILGMAGMSGPSFAKATGKSLWSDPKTLNIVQRGTVEEFLNLIQANKDNSAFKGILFLKRGSPKPFNFRMLNNMLGNWQMTVGNSGLVVKVVDAKGDRVNFEVTNPKDKTFPKTDVPYDFRIPETKLLLFLGEKILGNIVTVLGALNEDAKPYKWRKYGDAPFTEYAMVHTALGEDWSPARTVNNPIYLKAAKVTNKAGFGVRPEILAMGLGERIMVNPANPNPFNNVSRKSPRGATGLMPNQSYMIKGGMFGELEVDVPKLYTQMHLTAKKGGTIVIDKTIDKDGLELLTKRMKPGKEYSKDSMKTLAKMVKISEYPVMRNSKKLAAVQDHLTTKREKKAAKSGKGMKGEDPSISRLTTLISSMKAGNYPNAEISTEISRLSDLLLKEGKISKKLHKEIFESYVE